MISTVVGSASRRRISDEMGYGSINSGIQPEFGIDAANQTTINYQAAVVRGYHCLAIHFAGVAFGRSAKTLGGRNKAGISGQPLAQRANHGLQVKAVLRHRPDRPARFLDGLRRDGSDRGNDNPVHRRIKFQCSVKPSSNLLEPTHLRGAGERDQIDGPAASSSTRRTTC